MRRISSMVRPGHHVSGSRRGITGWPPLCVPSSPAYASCPTRGCALPFDLRLPVTRHLLTTHPPSHLYLPLFIELLIEEACLRLVRIPPFPPTPVPSRNPYRPSLCQSVRDLILHDLFFLLTTYFTSFDVNAFNNPMENIFPYLRGNAAGAQAS